MSELPLKKPTTVGGYIAHVFYILWMLGKTFLLGYLLYLLVGFFYTVGGLDWIPGVEAIRTAPRLTHQEKEAARKELASGAYLIGDAKPPLGHRLSEEEWLKLREQAITMNLQEIIEQARARGDEEMIRIAGYWEKDSNWLGKKDLWERSLRRDHFKWLTGDKPQNHDLKEE